VPALRKLRQEDLEFRTSLHSGGGGDQQKQLMLQKRCLRRASTREISKYPTGAADPVKKMSEVLPKCEGLQRMSHL
jgi:hypothetical protein